MGESVAVKTTVRRGLTLALTIFGLVLLTAVVGMFQVVEVIRHLPDSRASIGWIIGLIMIPAVITGIISGLTAALGAHISARMSTNSTGASASCKVVSAGAGLGGAVGSAPFLLYLSWWFQNGPGLWILVLGYIGIFVAYAGFAALWSGRRARNLRMPV